MEIKLNLKQAVFISAWILAVITALLLVMTIPHLNIYTATKAFCYLLFMFTGIFTMLLMGLFILTKW